MRALVVLATAVVVAGAAPPKKDRNEPWKAPIKEVTTTKKMVGVRRGMVT